ncbi:MAG TPA: RIP metalloprotease RseP [Candidatus Binatia bacterium]|nr:RIP metalloprotease RseP [Candidatus Binatia bacterium]
MEILKILFVIFEVVLLFNVLIFVHELGHFLAARWRGLHVERFAVWFGKPIWKKKIGDVEYVLGSIPAGGYVSLPQMAPMEIMEGKSDTSREDLPPVSAMDKIIVAFAGPIFSFLLAVVFALIVAAVGRPVTEAETTTVIGYVDKDSPAEKAGLQVGDRILEVDGKPVTKFLGMGNSVMWNVVRSEGATVPIKVERDVDGQKQVLTLEAAPRREPTRFWQRKSLRQVMIEPAHTPIVGLVFTNSPAARAGLQRGDEIHAVNSQKLYHFMNFADYTEKHPGVALTIAGSRNGAPFEKTLTPEVPVNSTDKKPRVGIEWDGSGGRMTIARPGVVEQLVGSVDAMVRTFDALFSRKSDISPQHLSGAVKIMNIYYVLFKSEQGWRQAIWFSVIMNVNLAILNLLPIPVLDGGHIMLAIIERVRRRPVSVRILQAIQTTCAVVIIGYMVYIAFFDVQELPWKRTKEKPRIEFAPQSTAPGASR